MYGESGNDIYIIDNFNDLVFESAGQGTDWVYSALSYTLGANVENLTLTGSAAISGTGNGLNNVLTGNSGNNTLTGGAGNDTLTGGIGNDIFQYDRLWAEGIDTIRDFAVGSDKISVAHAAYSQIHVAQSGNDTWITMDGSATKVILTNKQATLVTSASFIFTA